MVQLDESVGRIAGYANVVAGALILLLAFAQLVVVLMRYVFSIGVQWSQDLLVYLFMLSSVLPVCLVILSNNNVRVDLFYQGYKASTKTLLDRAGLLIFLLPVGAYATWVSIDPMLNSWALLEASPTFGGLPGYFILKTVQTAMFAGMAVVAVILLMREQPWPIEDPGKTD